MIENMNIAVERSPMVTIYVDHTHKSPNLDIQAIPWSAWLQTWFEQLKVEHNLAEECELSLQLTSDRQIQTLNHQYRSFDKPTDVLAFAATESEIILPEELAEPLYLGDIIISLDTAAKQAQEQQHTLVVELAWLASHGVLHLLGWDHPDDITLELMLQKQSQLVQLLNCS